jgi:hypothetical protein
MTFHYARLFAISAPIAAFASSALAASPATTSRYVKIDLEKCQVIEKVEEGSSTTWRCDMPGGFELYVTEGDLRFFIGYGPNGREQTSFRQTLAPFNNIRGTLELRYRAGAKEPHASILRYDTQGYIDGADEPKPGQVLVVTKIGGAEACHLAHIDALANPDANELARQAADSAESFDCGKDEPKKIGKTGKSPM